MNNRKKQKEYLLSLTSSEIINYFSNEMLKIIEDEIGMPIKLDIQRNKEVKAHQNLQTSILFSVIIGTLKFIGMYYSKKLNSTHINPFDFGLKLLLEEFSIALKDDLISEKQFLEITKLINEYILDEPIRYLKENFLIGSNNIPQYKMLFLLYEYVYQSPIHQSIYSFDGMDIRRSTFVRIEIATMNKYQDHKLNINNIEKQLLDSITNFNYNVHNIVNIISIQKEIEYRTDLLNKLYFNFEHFFSVIIKTFKLEEGKKITKKQNYLTTILNKLEINQHIGYKEIYNEIKERCKESSEDFLKLLEPENEQTISLINIFLQIINMRNSLHSNGASNKDINEFTIGKIHFKGVRAGEQYSSMAMHQIIVLVLITTYTIEKIIDKISKIKKLNDIEIPTIIIDKYLQHMKMLTSSSTLEDI